MIDMVAVMNYTETVTEGLIGDKKYLIKNLTPDFENENERKTTKQRISDALYNIFTKYCA